MKPQTAMHKPRPKGEGMRAQILLRGPQALAGSSAPLGEAGMRQGLSPPEEDAKPSAAQKAAHSGALGAEISA